MGALSVMLRVVVFWLLYMQVLFCSMRIVFLCRVCSDLSEMSSGQCRHEGVSSARVIFLAVPCLSSNACVCLYGVEMILMLMCSACVWLVFW